LFTVYCIFKWYFLFQQAFFSMMNAQKAEELGYDRMAGWVCGADFGVDPKTMGSVRPLLF